MNNLSGGKETVKIRKFTLNDLQECLEILLKAVEFSGEEAKKLAKRSTDYTMEKYLSQPDSLLVAEEDGKILGICFGHIEPENKKTGYLWYIAIDPIFQGRDIGSKLLENLTDYFRSQGVEKIEVGTAKPKAVSFYKKHGFTPIFWRFSKEIE